jgi:hypothetical protein
MDDDVFEYFVDESYENRIPMGSLDSAEKLLTSYSPSSPSPSGNSESRSSKQRSAGQTIRSE